jgi:hypothetical protein
MHVISHSVDVRLLFPSSSLSTVLSTPSEEAYAGRGPATRERAESLRGQTPLKQQQGSILHEYA